MLVELALVMGLLVLIVFGALVVNSRIREKQVLNGLLRTVSVQATRNCYRALLSEASESKVCLETVVNNALQQSKSMLPDYLILISVYRGRSPTVLELILRGSPPAASVGSETSRFSAVKAAGMMNTTEVLTVVEVFKPDTSLDWPFRRRLFGTERVLHSFAAF